jgi:hypothetical protein
MTSASSSQPVPCPRNGLDYCDDRERFDGLGTPLRTPHAVRRHLVGHFSDCPCVAVLHLDAELRLRCDVSLLGTPADILADVESAVAGFACPSNDVVIACVELRGRRVLLKRHHLLFDVLRDRYAAEGVVVHDLVVKDGWRTWSVAWLRGHTVPYVPARSWSSTRA